MALEFPALRAVILGCALLSSSCSDTYTPLVDPTDWVDRGEYAPCAFTPPPGTVADCDEPSLFDLSKCDTASLATLEPHGIYQVDMRHASGLADVAGIRLPGDGGTATMNYLPTMRSAPVTRQQLQGAFRISAQYTVRNLVFAGCGVTGPGLVTGCFARCTDGWRERLRAQVEEAMERGEPSLASVCARLGMSPRGLQRRLKAEGRTFREVTEDARLEKARRLLADDSLNVAGIAQRVGYSDARALRRAFQRWTGMSPGQRRESLGGEGPLLLQGTSMAVGSDFQRWSCSLEGKPCTR